MDAVKVDRLASRIAARAHLRVAEGITKAKAEKTAKGSSNGEKSTKNEKLIGIFV